MLIPHETCNTRLRRNNIYVLVSAGCVYVYPVYNGCTACDVRIERNIIVLCKHDFWRFTETIIHDRIAERASLTRYRSSSSLLFDRDHYADSRFLFATFCRFSGDRNNNNSSRVRTTRMFIAIRTRISIIITHTRGYDAP